MEMDEVCIRLSPPLWLWRAVSRRTRLILAFCFDVRSDAALSRLLEEEVPPDWRDSPVCTDGLGAYARLLPADRHDACDKGSGKTSIVEGLNTKWRQRQSGLVRKSCGISWRTRDDLWERFLILADRHNRQCLRRWNDIQATMRSSP